MNNQVWFAEYKAFQSDIAAGLGSLPSRSHRLAFGMACCQRLLPSYAEFQRNARWGNFRLVKDIAAAMWEHCRNQDIPMDVGKLIVKLEAASADDEALFEGSPIPGIRTAQAVCGALSLVGKYSAEGKESILVKTSQVTLDFFLNEALRILNERQQHSLSNDDEYATVWNSPVVKGEITMQKKDIKILESTRSTTIQQFVEARRYVNVNSLGHAFYQADLVKDYPTSYVLPGRSNTSAFVSRTKT